MVERARGLFCTRTLNLRSIKAIGYDMDYTLIHYRMEAWERRAYAFIKEGLLEANWPVEDLEFEPELAARGLVIDRELGNVVKANRFGFVKSACHGTATIPFEDLRRVYSRTVVDLGEPRWRFLNTLFAISECCMYMQLVDKLDRDELPGVHGYGDLYGAVRDALDAAHSTGRLKAEILADPARFVEPDAEVPLTLLDQKHAGKLVFLITNSEWSYAAPLMAFAFDRWLPDGMTWPDLFDVVIAGARKPDFFVSRSPPFAVVSDDGLLREHAHRLERGGRYIGGNANLVEASFGLAGEEILYVGDHIFSDVNVSKSVQRWRTALVVRELEDEVAAIDAFAEDEAELARLMDVKEGLEAELNQARLVQLRRKRGYGPASERSASEIDKSAGELRARITAMDEQIGPFAKAAAARSSSRWGLLLRAGKDKSHLARQIERHADVYTSRVSNFMHATPFVYLRSPQGSLPHDP